MRKTMILVLFAMVFGMGRAQKTPRNQSRTRISIENDQFYINDTLTYPGRYWQNYKIEGLLMNSRMVQGIFDDLNPKTQAGFRYPDTGKWDPNRNTREFIAAMPSWKNNGLLAFTLNLQGGSPNGYGSSECLNSAFDEQGRIRSSYLKRLEQILNKADELGMVVILGYFYFGQDQHVRGETAVIKGVDSLTRWLLNNHYTNVLVEINNECDIQYEHGILQADRVHELIERVQKTVINGNSLLAGTSFGGGTLPTEAVIRQSDFILLHGNGMDSPDQIEKLIRAVKETKGYTPKPILFNEDDHYNFEAESNNFVEAVKNYASWGFFDYRLKNESFENGFQSVPVDWGIHSPRKKSFFKKLKEITGY